MHAPGVNLLALERSTDAGLLREEQPMRNFVLRRPARWALPALFGSGVALSVGLLASPARAASLEQESGWDNAGMPGDITMHAYVPDVVAESPPIVVLIHYCGGTAGAVFGQAQGGGLVSAADTHGFLIIAPSSGRCWDVVSNKTRTRDGQGDSHAIRTMVTHAVDELGGNPDRVYVTGDSSGGMMTELLLGLYPDVFQGGSAMAGMPAACRGDSEQGEGGGYSGACAGGNVDRTPEEWGNIARSLHPGFTGRHPRVQIFHGDADDIIFFKNHTEAIEQWTNVLELSASPSETENLTLGSHQGLRETWTGPCGLPALEAFTSFEGDHGPSDALFLADHIVPFLGLDEPGLVDPYVAACESLGTGGSGSGGAGAGGSGGAGTGGTAGVGGAPGSGGHSSSSGGSPGTGGTNPAGGGSSASGGAPGGPASGGMTSTGGEGGSGAGAPSSGCNWRGGQPATGSTWGWPAGAPWASLCALLGLRLARRRRHARSRPLTSIATKSPAR